jgi:hypothetical protein
MAQSLKEKTATFATIETECHLVQIGREMLGAEAMPRSNDAALEQGERGFHRVRMNIAVNVYSGFVLNSHDYLNIFAHCVADVLGESSGFHVLSMEKPQIAAALPDTYNDLLFTVAVSGLAVSSLTCADVGFVHFDSSIHHGAFYFLHGSTNPVTEIPRCLIADSERALHLICRESLPGLNKQQDGGEPSCQWKMRVVENSSGSDREVIFALGTIELLIGSDPRNSFAPATRAHYAFRPAELNQHFPASFVCVEQSLYV